MGVETRTVRLIVHVAGDATEIVEQRSLARDLLSQSSKKPSPEEKMKRLMITPMLFALPMLLLACSERAETTEPTAKKPTQPMVSTPPTTPPLEPSVSVTEPEEPKIASPPTEEKSPQVEQKPEMTFAQAMKRARALREEGSNEQAIEMYLTASKLDANQSRPLVAASRLLIAGKQLDRARQLAEQAVKLTPGWSSGWNTLGRIENLQGKLKAAAQAFDKATECNESNIYAWNNLGLVRLKLRQYDEAVDALEQATDSDEATAYMYNNLGIAYERAKRVQEALTAYKAGLEKGSGLAGQNFVRLERKSEPFGG